MNSPHHALCRCRSHDEQIVRFGFQLADEEVERTEISLMPEQRTVRLVDDGPAKQIARFDTFTNSQTESKWRAFYRDIFVEAASRVIVRIRLGKRLSKITELARAIRTGAQNGQSFEKVLKVLFSPEELASPVCDRPPANRAVQLLDARYAVCTESDVQLETVRAETKAPSASAANVQAQVPANGTGSNVSTPRSARETHSNSMFERYEQPLRPVQVADAFTTLVVRRELPIFEFEIPQHARLMVYARVDPYDAETSYIPADCPRTFRGDPQDDVEAIRLDTIQPPQPPVPASTTATIGKPGERMPKTSVATQPSKMTVPAPPAPASSMTIRDRPTFGTLSTIKSESTGTLPPTRLTMASLGGAETRQAGISTVGPSQFSTQQTNMDAIIQTPGALFKPVSYDELHVFNPAPGKLRFTVTSECEEISTVTNRC